MSAWGRMTRYNGRTANCRPSIIRSVDSGMGLGSESGFEEIGFRYIEFASRVPFTGEARERVARFLSGQDASREFRDISWGEDERFRAQLQAIRFMDLITARASGRDVVDARTVDGVIASLCPGFWPFC